MRVVGQFNNQPIALESLFITQTYLGFLSIVREDFPEINKGILEETIPELIEKHFGKKHKFIVVKDADLDLANRLPEEIAFASLIGASSNQDADFSFLTIAWLKKPSSDLYLAIEETVKQLDWAKEAVDGNW